MAQLHQILGAVLRDIAQARVTSDIYSREVSRYYEQDSLLRLFPIPRTEIREASIDLRFAISDIDIDPERGEDREARIARILDYRSGTITGDIIKDLRGPTTVQGIEEWQALVQQLDLPEFRSSLRLKILDYFETNSSTLITVTVEEDEVKVDFDTTKARAGISAIVDALIYTREDVVALDEQYGLLSKVKGTVSRGLGSQLEVMQSDLELMGVVGEFKVEVDVTADKLQGIPDAAISSLKITTTVRNYVWSQVEEREGTAVRRLIPE